jgi:RimJ/RimL family protein N-acetyltransferase
MIETIVTERLLMRAFTEEDLDPLTELHAEPSFWWFPLRRGMEPEETSRFLSRVLADNQSPDRPAFQALVERSSGALMGWAGLSIPDFLPEVLPATEVGWRLGTRYRGHGYATEAATAALHWGFEDLGLEAIISIFEPENVASGKVMDRLGFGPGVETTHPGRALPLLVRTLTVEEWRAIT